MALWEVSFQIVDKNKTHLQGDELMYAWNNADISQTAINRIKEEIGISKSWHKDIEMIGSEDDILIKVSKIDNLFCEISCRYNVIQSSSQKTIKLLEFMKEINSVIFYDNLFYEPEYNTFINLIKKSDAAEFVVNPKKYFNKISKK